jgi:hypothetical protein
MQDDYNQDFEFSEEEITADGKPKQDDFETYEDWQEAVMDWKLDGRIEEMKKDEAQAHPVQQPLTIDQIASRSSPNDQRESRERSDLATNVEENLASANRVEIAGDHEKARDYRGRAAIDAAELEERRKKPYEYQQLYEDKVRQDSEEVVQDLTKVSEREIQENKDSLDALLHNYNSQSLHEHSYVVSETNQYYKNIDGQPIPLKLKIIRVGHGGETAARVVEKAEQAGLTVFEYLCREHKVPVSIKAFKKEKGEPDKEKKVTQKEYEQERKGSGEKEPQKRNVWMNQPNPSIFGG